MYYGEIIQRASIYLRGKHKPTYRNTKYTQGDVVIIVNAEKMTMPGTRLKFKKVKYHTGHPGGIRAIPFTYLLHKKPEYLFYRGVYKNLPRNLIRFRLLKNLHVYQGPEVPLMDFLPNVT
jgi:large subunit ribosomal protein L13